MTTRDKYIAQKKKEIEKIEKQQAKLMKQMQKLSSLHYKHPATLLRRVPKFLAIYRKAQALEVEKQIIISMPLPKRDIGGVVAGDMAVLPESGPEYITVGNFRIYPTTLVKKDEYIVAQQLKTSASGSF